MYITIFHLLNLIIIVKFQHNLLKLFFIKNKGYSTSNLYNYIKLMYSHKNRLFKTIQFLQ